MSDDPVTRFAFCGTTFVGLRFRGAIWTDLRGACRAFGVGYPAQCERLTDLDRSPWATVIVLPGAGGAEGERDVWVDVGTLGMWLATVDEAEVAPEMRPVVIACQQQCARVLEDRFVTRTATGELLVDPVLADLVPGLGIRRPFPGHEKESMN